MGDRALVVFTSADGKDASPVIYLHWAGHDVPELLSEHAALMRGRDDDPDYAAARFCGICHSKSPKENTGIGLFNSTPELLADPAKASHGDAGVIIVNTGDWSWKAHGGYLSRFDHAKASMPDEDNDEAA